MANDKKRKASEISIDVDLLETGEPTKQLGITPEQEADVKGLLASLKFALEDNLEGCYSKMYIGGSYAKGTALTYLIEVIMVIYLNDFDASKMKEYMSFCKEAISDTFGEAVKFTPKEGIPYAIDVEIMNQVVEIQITGDPADNKCGNQERFYLPARLKAQDDQILAAMSTFPVLKELILVTKHWKQQANSDDICSDDYVELLALQTVKMQTEKKPLRSIRGALRAFLENIVLRGSTLCINKLTGEEIPCNKRNIMRFAKTLYQEQYKE